MVSSTHPYARRNTTRGHPVRFDIQLVGRCRCALPGRASICCARALDMAVSSGPTQWDAHDHCTGTGRQAGGGTDSGGHVRARCDATRLAGINVGGHLDSHCKPTVNGEPTFDASSTHSTRPRRVRRRDSAPLGWGFRTLQTKVGLVKDLWSQRKVAEAMKLKSIDS